MYCPGVSSQAHPLSSLSLSTPISKNKSTVWDTVAHEIWNPVTWEDKDREFQIWGQQNILLPKIGEGHKEGKKREGKGVKKSEEEKGKMKV